MVSVLTVDVSLGAVATPQVPPKTFSVRFEPSNRIGGWPSSVPVLADPKTLTVVLVVPAN